jgi:hypothetical protein
MALRLADGVHAVLVGSDCVFLGPKDYYCLPLPAQALDLLGPVIIANLPGLGDALCDSGLVVQGPANDAIARDVTPISPGRTARRIVDEQIQAIDRRPRLRHWWALAKSLVAAFRTQSWPISDLIDRRGPIASEAPSLRLLSDLTVYRRILPWLPIDGLCLFRSYMLISYLNALGHGARWVFGVRTWPFRAHCWLQVGDVALDDEAERLAAYHPIMAA